MSNSPATAIRPLDCEDLPVDSVQMQRFVERIFAKAAPGSRVSIRAFPPKGSGGHTIIRDTTVGLEGTRFSAIMRTAAEVARFAANAPIPYAFAPPLCTFVSAIKPLEPARATEGDVAQALTFSVGFDTCASRSLANLSALIGVPPSVTVASGGSCWDVELEDERRLHAHWILSEPAIGLGLETLNACRLRAAELSGGDLLNARLAYPTRWPGSWHRKDAPVMCQIVDETASTISITELVTRLKLPIGLIRARGEITALIKMADRSGRTAWGSYKARHAAAHVAASRLKEAGATLTLCVSLMNEHWNRGCRPPMDHEDVADIVRCIFNPQPRKKSRPRVGEAA